MGFLAVFFNLGLGFTLAEISMRLCLLMKTKATS